jgi:hypothetical protein
MLTFTAISQDVTVYKQAKSAFWGVKQAAAVSAVARNSTAAQLQFKATQAVLYPQPHRHDGFFSSCSLYCNQNKPPMDIPYNAASLRRGVRIPVIGSPWLQHPLWEEVGGTS